MNRRNVVVTSALAIGALASPVLFDHAPKLVWNASASAPIGLYAIEDATDLKVTDLVAVRPPEPLASALAESGYLPKGVPLLKRIAALPKQKVCRANLSIRIDEIEFGEARERDGRGRPLPSWRACRAIADGEVFLMNWDNPDSYDGRYFGPLPAASIIGRAVPLWTFESD
jgi:conjugative transfer signal peptidase TraF